MFNENVSSKLVKSIQSMYKSVKVAVKSNNETSPLFDSNIGVKQGDPSSSLIFLFFVNDILTNVMII